MLYSVCVRVGGERGEWVCVCVCACVGVWEWVLVKKKERATEQEKGGR